MIAVSLAPGCGTVIELMVFLGNPGREYENTRHNVAWRLAEALSIFPSLEWKKKFKGTYARRSFGSGAVYFLKPLTYMNGCGESVSSLMSFFGISAGKICVVHDEVELSFGRIDCRMGGGLAGHNGLRSVAGRLGTREFIRFRVGVSRPSRGSLSSYVLGRFSREEEEALPSLLAGTAQLLEGCLNAEYGETAFLSLRKISVID